MAEEDSMKLKLDDAGHVVVSEGKPVYVHDDGREAAFDAPGTVATISRLNAEAKSHREAKEAAEKALKSFEGITDPAVALQAMETVKNLGDGELVKAGKVEEIKAAAAKAAEERERAAAKAHADELARVTAERDAITGRYHGEKITGAFTGSKFITEKIAVPADMIRKTFGDQFKVDETGKLVAFDSAGKRIYSIKNGGEDADFEEAIEMLVSAYPFRDQILKGSGASGGGARGSNGAANGGGKSIPRAQFDAMDPTSKAKLMAEGTQVE